MSNDEEVFRPTFSPIFLVVFLTGAGICGAATIALRQMGYAIPGVLSYSFLRILCMVYLWAMICAFSVIVMLKVHVSATGLRGRTFWGTAASIDWGDMESVSRHRVLGFSFLKAFSFEGGAPIWVPLFLKEPSAFRAQVEGAVSDTHPIRGALDP